MKKVLIWIVLLMTIAFAGYLAWIKHKEGKFLWQKSKQEETAYKPDMSKRGNCTELANKIENCEVYKCQMPHPFFKDFTIEHHVMGKLPDGNCRHTQTAPGGSLVSCSYKDETRKIIADSLRADPNKISKQERADIAEAFKHECEILQERNQQYGEGKK